MPDHLTIESFLSLQGVCLDVRSPGEYAKGHIPGAVNLPLFFDAERAAVGTVYKQQGHQEAVALGLQYVGPKLAQFAATAQHLQKTQQPHGGSPFKVHCWRGGMRSSSFASFLEMVGMPSATLKGGYKAFRRRVLEVLHRPLSLVVIGGLTGSGKTRVLHALEDLGEQVLDLEALANHRGSAFGKMGEQPTTEQFENDIAMKLACYDARKVLWIEDESRLLGQCMIPKPVFMQMQQAPLFTLEIPLNERVGYLQEDYAACDPEMLITAVMRLQKKLGLVKAKEIVTLIREGSRHSAAGLMLDYYDKAYRYSLSRRQQPFFPLQGSGLSPHAWGTKLLHMQTSCQDPEFRGRPVNL